MVVKSGKKYYIRVLTYKEDENGKYVVSTCKENLKRAFLSNDVPLIEINRKHNMDK